MKLSSLFLSSLFALLSAVAFGRPQQAVQTTPPAAKTPEIPAQGQALIDGMLAYSDDGSGKMTLEGPAARVLFLKMSDERITSKQPTDECQPAVIKSGDNLECGHCEVHGKSKKDDFNYWCVLNVDTQFGKIQPNTTISAPAPSQAPQQLQPPTLPQQPPTTPPQQPPSKSK